MVAGKERLVQVGPEQLDAPVAQVGDGRQSGDLELRLGRRLDVAELAMLARLHQRQRDALTAGSPVRPMRWTYWPGRTGRRS